MKCRDELIQFQDDRYIYYMDYYITDGSDMPLIKLWLDCVEEHQSFYKQFLHYRGNKNQVRYDLKVSKLRFERRRNSIRNRNLKNNKDPHLSSFTENERHVISLIMNQTDTDHDNKHDEHNDSDGQSETDEFSGHSEVEDHDDRYLINVLDRCNYKESYLCEKCKDVLFKRLIY